MAPPKAKTAAPAKTAAAKTAAKKALPRTLKKLVSHQTTRHLYAKLKRSAAKRKVAPETLLNKPNKFVEKKIGGDKNGGTRKVYQKKATKYYPTEPLFRKRKSGSVPNKAHKRSLKPGLEPGKVLIVLAGRHRGKRVVFLKQLASGLLLVNGPFTVNKCPLRRMHQQFVIVTSTKLDVSGVKVPDHINDKYFKVKKEKKAKKSADGNVFAQEKKSYKPDEQRKQDQKNVDKQLLDVIRKNGQKKLLFSYLGSFFQLRNRMHPHKLNF